MALSLSLTFFLSLSLSREEEGETDSSNNDVPSSPLIRLRTFVCILFSGDEQSEKQQQQRKQLQAKKSAPTVPAPRAQSVKGKTHLSTKTSLPVITAPASPAGALSRQYRSIRRAVKKG